MAQFNLTRCLKRKTTCEPEPPEDASTEVASKVMKCFQRAEARSKFTDFVVHVDDRKFPCHRFVLSSCSGFFEALLRCDMREKNERQATVKGITSATFELVLDAMYGSRIALTGENMFEVWHDSNQLQIEFLIEICEHFILKSINLNNFWDVYVNAECLISPTLMDAVKRFMVQKFFQVTNSDEFIRINFDALLAILRDDNLPVCTDFIVESILKWANIKFEWSKSAVSINVQPIATHTLVENRKDRIDQLLLAAKLENASKDCLVMLMTNEDILGNKDAIREVNKHVAKDYLNLVRKKKTDWLDFVQGYRRCCLHCHNPCQNTLPLDSKKSVAVIFRKRNEETGSRNLIAVLKPANSSRPTAVNAEVACRVIQCFQKAEARNNFTDFVVHVDDYEFPCHRFVLSSCSGFFEALLRSDMREKYERQATVIGIAPATFQLVLDAMYGSCAALTGENMLEVWHASNQLQIEFLIEMCETHILKSINFNNFWDIYVNAECLDSVKVMSAVKNYMVQNFFQVANSDEFMKIYFEDLLEILGSKNLPVCTDFIVESILKWTNIAFECNTSAKSRNGSKKKAQVVATDTMVENRKDRIAQLLQAVKLQDASKDCLAMLMTNEDILGNRDAIREVNKHVAKDYVTGQKNGRIQETMQQNYLGFYHDQRFTPAYPNFNTATTDVKKCPHCKNQPKKTDARGVW